MNTDLETLTKAQAFIDIGNYERIIEMRHDLERIPKSEEACSILATAFEELQQYEAAILLLTKAIELNAGEVDYLYRRGRIQLCFLQMDPECSVGGIKDLEACIKLDQNIFMAHYLLCLEQILQSVNLAKAKSHLLKLLELDPISPATFYCSGQFHLAIGDFPTAIDSFEAGVKVDSVHRAALFYGLASTRKSMGTAQDALLGVDAISRAIKIEPSPMHYCLRSSLNIFLGDLTSAQVDLEIAKSFSCNESEELYMKSVEKKLEDRRQDEK